MESKNIADMSNTAMYLRMGYEEAPEEEDDVMANELVDQSEECQAFCRDNGFEIKDKNIYYDIASGLLPPEKRPGLRSLLNVVRRKEITTIVVYRIDRLVRGLNSFVQIVHELNGLGATIQSVTESLKITNLFEKSTLEVLFSIAQMEPFFRRQQMEKELWKLRSKNRI